MAIQEHREHRVVKTLESARVRLTLDLVQTIRDLREKATSWITYERTLEVWGGQVIVQVSSHKTRVLLISKKKLLTLFEGPEDIPVDEVLATALGNVDGYLGLGPLIDLDYVKSLVAMHLPEELPKWDEVTFWFDKDGEFQMSKVRPAGRTYIQVRINWGWSGTFDTLSLRVVGVGPLQVLRTEVNGDHILDRKDAALALREALMDRGL